MSETTNNADTTEQPSQTADVADNNERPPREPARRVFAREFADATFQFQAQDGGEQATLWVQLPTGQRLNRVYIVGTLVATDDSGDIIRFQLNDGHDDFTCYAGGYEQQPQERIQEITPPAYVAVVGKVNRYAPDDGDEVYLSVKAEQLTTVDEATRTQWVMDTAASTYHRIQAFRETDTTTDVGNIEERPHAVGDITRAAALYGEDLKPYQRAVEQALQTTIIPGEE